MGGGACAVPLFVYTLILLSGVYCVCDGAYGEEATGICGGTDGGGC